MMFRASTQSMPQWLHRLVQIQVDHFNDDNDGGGNGDADDGDDDDSDD